MHLLKMHYYALFEKTLTNLSMQTFITFVSKRLIPLIVANLNVFCGKKGWKPAFFGLKHREFFCPTFKKWFHLEKHFCWCTSKSLLKGKLPEDSIASGLVPKKLSFYSKHAELQSCSWMDVVWTTKMLQTF